MIDSDAPSGGHSRRGPRLLRPARHVRFPIPRTPVVVEVAAPDAPSETPAAEAAIPEPAPLPAVPAAPVGADPLTELRAAQLRRIDAIARTAFVLLAALFAVVLLRVAQLQLAPESRLQPHIQDRITRRHLEGARGDLLDRRGRILAATRTGYRLFLDPSAVQTPVEPLVRSLSDILGVDQYAIAERLIGRMEASRRRVAGGGTPIRYLPMSRVLTDQQVEAIRRLDLPGIHLERICVREPIGAGAAELASLVGKVDWEHDGLIGAERIFDETLQPTAGHMDYVRDARGRPLWVEANGYAASVRGRDARLSIDSVIQQIATEEIARGVLDADAAGGRIIVLDPHTGEILAMADHIRDLPGLVELKPGEPVQPGVRYRTIKPDPARAIHPALGRNRCVEDVYEPGSTFKPFMWACVTERGLASPDEIVNVHDGLWETAYGRPLADVTPKGEITWREVLVYSSNIGMAQITERLTAQQMRDDVLRFGFGKRTGLPLAGEATGIVTSARAWSKYTHTSVAMGYEVAVTPLQMVRAFSAFAREGDLAGTLPALRLQAVTDPSSVDTATVRVLPDWVAYLTRETMAKVAENMAGRVQRDLPPEERSPYDMFGKSGTAKISKPGSRGYFEHQYHSSFIVGAPVKHPRIVVLAVIDDPGPALIAQRRHYGSSVAGPVVLRTVKRTLEYLGILPEPAQDDSAEDLVASN